MNLLTDVQAAEFLNLSDKTLRNWRSLKKGPPYKRYSAGCIRYDEAELRQWLEDVTERPNSKEKAKHPKSEDRSH